MIRSRFLRPGTAHGTWRGRGPLPPGVASAVLAVALTGAGMAAAAPPGGAALPTQAWPLEAVELRDGRRLEGLILGDAPDGPPGAEEEIAIVQVVRPPGRPMYLVTWGPIAGDRVDTLERLPEAARRTLAERVQAFRAERTQRAAAEATLPLERAGDDGPWRYAGADFTVESRADPAITRAAVVRLEQVCGALAALVPPRAGAEPDPLRVRLCGSAAEYRAVQESLGVAIDNPAFYVPLRRLLVAGSDMADLVARDATAAAALDAAAQRYAELDRTLADRLRALAADLEKQGVAPAARGEIVARARGRWDRERTAALAGIETARRVNAGAVARARATFHARLAHEAWHAYADGRLRAPGTARLPLWLDEGIAQVVESAPLEAGELRLDAPDPDRLARLQQALRAGRVPPLADVLRAGQERFLSGHGGTDGGLVYLAAWGLALDTALLRPVLSAPALGGLEADDADPVAAFESLVGMPLEQYEPAWRRRILGLRPAAVVRPDG